MFIKLLLIILFFALTPGTINTVLAQKEPVMTNKVEVIFFLRDGCAHCDNEDKFLTELEKKRKDIIVTRYHLERENDRKVWEKFTNQVQISKVTPITVIGNNYIIGFDKPDTTGKEIIKLIDTSRDNFTPTILNEITPDSNKKINSTCDESGLEPCVIEETYIISLPFLGNIDALSYPLLALSIILGFIDGFNPCAMWVLVTFLIILMQVGDKRKMFIFAGTFILAEAIMYTLILTVWYKTWDFVQMDSIVTPIIGILSIIGGVFFLREWRKKELECKVTNISQKKKTMRKIHSLVSGKFTFITFLSILGIAFSVNIIEFACSIGIPQAFTKILEMNDLNLAQTGLYIGTYILFYMIDDIIVFSIALFGINKLGLTTKYTKFSNLIGGIIMIILGFILIFKPNFLAFF